MVRRKAASRGETSRRTEEGHQEEEVMSTRGKTLKLTNREKALLKNEAAIKRYENDIGHREIEMGRTVDFVWLEKENSLEIDSWLQVVGWNEFVDVNETVYPRLVRILYANLDPYSMTSWIGDKIIKLDVATWCDVFNIPNLDAEEEEDVRTLSKDELFSNLFHKEKMGHKAWINAGELPPDATVRLAVSILMNIIIPKRGSKEQIKEEEARVLYALKNGKDLNVAREIVDRVRQSTLRRSTPLCYPMHLMVIMKKAGVNPNSAGDVELMQLKSTSFIDSRTLTRLGFRKDITRWNLVGRGQARSKFMGESYVPTGEAAAEAEAREEEEGGAADSQPMPSTQPRPSTSTHRPAPTPQIHSQLADLSTQLAFLASTLTEKLDYLQANLNLRLNTVESRLDDLSLQVKNCEILLTQLHSSSTHQSTPTATPTPTPQPPPEPSPPTPQPETLFTMEDLLGSVTQPQQPTTTAPPPQSEPIPILSPVHPSQASSPTSSPTIKRLKRAVSKQKPPSKDFSKSFSKKPKPSS